MARRGPDFEIERARIARTIYRALSGADGAYVSGHPDEGRTTLDGVFSLTYVAERVLAALQPERTQQTPDRECP